MPEALLNDLGMHALLQKQGGVAVSQIVEPNRKHLAPLYDPSEVPLSHIMGVERFPIALAENECMVVPFPAGLAHLLGPILPEVA